MSGNPIRYNNGTQWGFSWSEGRNLKVATKSSTTFTFQYDASGLRTQKNSANSGSSRNSTYLYAGGKLLRETRAVSVYHGPSSSSILDFTYDATGAPYSLIYNNGRTTATYYYITNLQGDVMYLVDETGAEVAAYTYDPYGKVLSATGTMAGVNPLRYRGYYQDSETGFYYLQSRYYDPEIGRFINADSYASTGQGLLGFNMFVYCNNNPVNLKDPTGQSSITALIFKTVVALRTAVTSICFGEPTSNVGSAKPYVNMPGSDDLTTPNCYAYAIGSPVNEQPGNASGCYPTKWNNVFDVGKSVKADLTAKGYTVREILGPDAKVYENEFKIALRVGTQPYTYAPFTGEPYYDYHFMVQTDTGQWAEKHGVGGASILWDLGMTPDTIPWTLGDMPYYNSLIIYYAVGK